MKPVLKDKWLVSFLFFKLIYLIGKFIIIILFQIYAGEKMQHESNISKTHSKRSLSRK